jgi:UDP:flavonoid glycosyltransferase YjiC (YdhE family)
VAGSYLFAMWAGGGNVNPFLGLAGHLLDRGHRVGALATATLHDRLAEAGIDIVGAPDGWLAGADDLLTAARDYSPDVLVVDYMLTAALCGAERSGRPTVALVHTLYRELLLDGSPNPIGMAGSVAEVNEVRVAIGLAPIASHAELLDAADLVLVTAPRALDAPGEVPPNVVYAGALFEGPGTDDGWQPPRGEPLVLVSMGTAGDPTESDLMQRILDALSPLPVQGFVTVPDYIERSHLEPPANVTLTDYVRHAAVMPHADLLVTHAGLGSVVVALAYGVPMVCIPLGREQPDNARAVVRVGAGCALNPNAKAEEIRTAISEQLRRPNRVRMEPDARPAVARLEALPRERNGAARRV